jgi:hypothetical protein
MTDKDSVSSSRISLRTPLDMPFDGVSIPTTRGSRQGQTVQPQVIIENPKNPKPTNKELQKRISSYSLNKTMNGSGSVRYLHINSRHLPRQPNQEQFSINLLEPIRNASHMELTAFSVANDFSNVMSDNNKFRMIFKRQPDTGVSALNDLYMIEVSLEAGFYTHSEMIEGILAQITLTSNGFYDSGSQTPDGDGFYTVYPKLLAVGSSTFTTQTTYGVLFKPTVESNGKTTIEFKVVGGVADGLKYAFLSYPYEKYDEYFHDSLLHRLGYTKQQIYFSDEDIIDSGTVFTETAGSNNSVVLTNQRIVLEDVIPNSIAVSSTIITGYSRNFSNSARQKYTSAKLAFETHSHVQITCDLIHDIQTTSYNYKTLGKTEFSDVLAEVPIEVNRASWVHYLPQALTHVHKIDNALIRNFKLGLKNIHSNRHFKSQNDEHKQFQITLKIYIMDDETIPNQEFFNSIKQGDQNFSYRN